MTVEGLRGGTGRGAAEVDPGRLTEWNNELCVSRVKKYLLTDLEEDARALGFHE